MCSGYGSTEDETDVNLLNKSQITNTCICFDELKTSSKSVSMFTSNHESDSANTDSYEQSSIELELAEASFMENDGYEVCLNF